MIEIKNILNQAAEKCGFIREKYEDNNLPNLMSNVTAMIFLGDISSNFVLSSLLLKRYREEVKGSRYFILCGFPGYSGLFPYVDEYWAIKDENFLKKLYVTTNGFNNSSELIYSYRRNMNNFFEDIVDFSEMNLYYKNGITQKFWDKFRHVKKFLPMVPSIGILSKEFNRDLATKSGYKVFLFPTINVNSWRYGSSKLVQTDKSFWISLVQRCLAEGIVPVLYKHPLTYDLSSEFTDKCIYYSDRDVSRLCSAMRAVGCVVDIFSGFSRLSIVARCPFISIDERSRYNAVKEYEIDDLCASNIPKKYIFTFTSILEVTESKTWNLNLFNQIIQNIKDFIPELTRDSWPSTIEQLEIVPYEVVRRRKTKKIGARLFKIPKD